jgi:hypothetical protein
MHLNKQCRWERCQKVGKGVRGIGYTRQVPSIQNILEK